MELGKALQTAATFPGPVACDVETDTVHWWRSTIGVVSFAWGMGEDEAFATRSVDAAQAALTYRMVSGLPTVFHNSGFDLHCWRQRSLKVNWDTVHDTMLMARLHNNLGQNDLGSLGESELGIPKEQKNAVKAWLAKNNRAFIKEKGREPNYLDVPDEILLPYAAHDTRLTIGLYYRYLPASPLYEKERRTRQMMFDAEERGVELNVPLTERRLAQTRTEQDRVESKLVNLRGEPINLNSDAQLRRWLYDDLDLTPVSFTEKGGAPQTNDYNLMSNPHPVTRLLHSYNKRVKAGEFFASYLNLMDDSGVIHPTINTLQARTHRFSCSDPNLQQIPARSDRFHTRQVFIAGSGYFIGADYDKQEIFIAACEGNDQRLLSELMAGKCNCGAIHGPDCPDVYVNMARAMLDKEYITGNERQAAKIAVLSILYGAGAPKVAESFTLNTGKPFTVEQARVARSNFKEAYPGLGGLMDRMQQQGRSVGVLRNRWGRQLFVEKERAYVATDYLVQSSGRDVMVDAMLNVMEILPQYGGRILWPIHDEVLLWVPEQPTPELLDRVAEAMVCYKYEIPLRAKPKYGKTLADLK